MMNKRACKFLPCATDDMPAVIGWLQEQAQQGLIFDFSILSLCFFKKRSPVEMSFSLHRIGRKEEVPMRNKLGSLGSYTVCCTKNLDLPTPAFYTTGVILGALIRLFAWLFCILFMLLSCILDVRMVYIDWRDIIMAIVILGLCIIRIPPALPAIFPAARGKYYRHPALRAITTWFLWVALFALAIIP